MEEFLIKGVTTAVLNDAGTVPSGYAVSR